MYTTRAKIPKENLTRNQKLFCKLMAEGKTSIEAYNDSHHTVNKVRASTYLQNPFIWDRIVQEYKKDGKETHLVASYDKCISIVGIPPTKIFNDYFCDKQYFNENDSNPLYALKRQCAVWPFFIDLDREYFINKLLISIKQDYEYLCILIKNNPEWLIEFDEFRKDMKTHNISLSKILDYDK